MLSCCPVDFGTLGLRRWTGLCSTRTPIAAGRGRGPVAGAPIVVAAGLLGALGLGLVILRGPGILRMCLGCSLARFRSVVFFACFVRVGEGVGQRVGE